MTGTCPSPGYLTNIGWRLGGEKKSVVGYSVSCPAGGAQAFPDGIEEGHLSDDEGEGGEETDKKKKLKKKKKKVIKICTCC